MNNDVILPSPSPSLSQALTYFACLLRSTRRSTVRPTCANLNLKIELREEKTGNVLVLQDCLMGKELFS